MLRANPHVTTQFSHPMSSKKTTPSYDHDKVHKASKEFSA